jgi:hypothetical protein
MSLALFALIGLSLAPSDDELLARAEQFFAMGVRTKNDAALARPLFAKSAEAYDQLWNRGHNRPAIAANRARAHRLAGDLPGAIAALHEGRTVARYDRGLQVELAEARAAVPYHSEDLAAQCRPQQDRGIGTRMSPIEAYLAVGGLWLIACLGVARFAMSRAPGWLAGTGLALVAIIALGWLWREDWQARANLRPLVIVKHESRFKTGNGETWPDRLKWSLPPGVEARELTRRGGWVQVELASGVAGWLPETSLIEVVDAVQ